MELEDSSVGSAVGALPFPSGPGGNLNTQSKLKRDSSNMEQRYEHQLNDFRAGWSLDLKYAASWNDHVQGSPTCPLTIHG